MKRDPFESTLLAAGTLAAGPLAAGPLAAVLLVAVLLTACQNLSAQDEQAAIIANPTAETRAELHDVLVDALGGRSITLSPDALTNSSTLTLEGAARGDLQGINLRGRDLGRPITFDLLTDGEACFLVRRSTRQRWLLMHTTCTPAAAAGESGND